MPITAPYIDARIALLRLTGFNRLLSTFTTIEANLLTTGMSAVQYNLILSNYKSKLLNYFNAQIQRASDEAVVYALAGASESDEKNGLLTPIISATPVNPAAATNLIEQTAMLADGVIAGEELTDLTNKVTSLLT